MNHCMSDSYVHVALSSIPHNLQLLGAEYWTQLDQPCMFPVLSIINFVFKNIIIVTWSKITCVIAEH